MIVKIFLLKQHWDKYCGWMTDFDETFETWEQVIDFLIAHDYDVSLRSADKYQDYDNNWHLEINQ